VPIVQLGSNTSYWHNTSHFNRNCNGQDVPPPLSTYGSSQEEYLKIPKPAMDLAPFDYSIVSKDTIERIICAFRLFDADTNPNISQLSAYEAHAAVLKATLCFWEALNPRFKALQLGRLIGERSIREGPSFVDSYATLYKYIRQCIWGTNWVVPDEYPFKPNTCPFGAGSWLALRKLLKPRGEDITPEIIPPPELLYPWRDFTPTKIKDRYQSGNSGLPSSDLDLPLVREIINECLAECRVVPTMTDFIASQCDTHKVAKYDNLIDYGVNSFNQCKLEGKWTTFKYAKIPEWVDKQPTPTDKNMFAIRTPVWKRVSEYRDATTYSTTLLHQIWLLNQTLKYSWSDEISNSIGDYCDHQSLKEWVGKNCRGDKYTVNTDYKSSGLTMPHWFAKEVCTIINHKNRNSGLVVQFPYDGWPILDKESGDVYRAKTFGYGLGSVNNLYTLFNIVIHKYGMKKQIIEEDSQILSFNDDSTFSHSEPVLGNWLKLVRSFGGWADASKSVQLKGGTWFCEIHQLKFLAGNYKFVTAFHTMVNTILKAVNRDHWRFLSTETFDSIRGWNHDISPTGVENAKGIIESIGQYTLNFGERFWGTKFDINCPIPEAGGISLGYGTRTPYAIKGSLVWLERAKEQFSVQEYIKYATTFRASKEYLNRKIEYRPWAEFPDGYTKDHFKYLGTLKGIHFELKQFADKADNQFITDSHWHRNKLWLDLYDYIDKKLISDPYKEGFFDWALKQDWPNEAIPSAFVEEEIFFPENYVLPWVELPEVKAKTTITSMVIGFVTGQVPVDKLDFRPFFRHPTLVQEADAYIPVHTQYELEQILAHGSPKKMILDYFLRTGFVPKTLKTEPKMSKACLSLLEVIHKDDIPFKADGATWWTTMPIAYRIPWLEEVRYLLPHHQERLLIEIYLRAQDKPGDEFIKYSVLDVIEDKKFNSAFWKEQTKLKKKKEKSKQDDSGTVTQMFPHVKIRDRKYADIDNIDIIPVLDDLFNKQIAGKSSLPPPRTVDVMELLSQRKPIEALVLEDEPEDTPEDEWWLRDDTHEDSEEDLVAQYLNDGEWFADVEADTGVG